MIAGAVDIISNCLEDIYTHFGIADCAIVARAKKIINNVENCDKWQCRQREYDISLQRFDKAYDDVVTIAAYIDNFKDND